MLLKEKKICGNINFIFCTDEELLKLNKKYLHHNTYTDVITFNYNDNDLSGDIYISIDRVRLNSVKYKVTFNNELHRVMLHGVLHLIGYNDKSKKQKETMVKAENKYLILQYHLLQGKG